MGNGRKWNWQNRTETLSSTSRKLISVRVKTGMDTKVQDVLQSVATYGLRVFHVGSHVDNLIVLRCHIYYNSASM